MQRLFVTLLAIGVGAVSAVAQTTARVGFGIESNVARGENAGRRLRHDFVVTALASKKMLKTGDAWTAEFVLPPGRAAGTGAGFVVWMTGPDGRPFQAAGSESR